MSSTSVATAGLQVMRLDRDEVDKCPQPLEICWTECTQSLKARAQPQPAAWLTR
jgi:hypothetical protein